jgi:glycosyltransferase involved in cell wall biosynthesis
MIVAPFSMEMSEIPASSGDERWVGYHLGAMDWIPNREGMRWFLEEVWPKIHNAIPRFEFYYAGRNMPQEFVEMNIEGVHCVENVDSAPEFIADKKILIVPISSGGGIRVKILEAMAAGKVVITTPDGIKGIEAKAGEHYLMARKPEDFVRLVRWCLLNKEKAQQMAERGRQLVSTKYEYGSVIKTVIDQIEVLIKLRFDNI